MVHTSRRSAFAAAVLFLQRLDSIDSLSSVLTPIQLPSTLAAEVRLPRRSRTKALSWYDKDDNKIDFYTVSLEESISNSLKVARSSGSETLKTTFQPKIRPRTGQHKVFLEQCVKEAHTLDLVAKAPIPEEQLLHRAVRARDTGSSPTLYTNNLNFCKKPARVTTEQEIQLARMIQKGTALQSIKQQLTAEFGREPTKQEWADRAGMSIREIRTHVSQYRAAKHKLVMANIGLVHGVVRQYRHRTISCGLTNDELVQEGSMGLIRAAELFDPSRGVSFSTYATVWIKGVLGNSHAPELITLPQREKTIWNKISKAQREISAAYGQPASVEQLERATGVVAEKILETYQQMRQTRRVKSLDYRYKMYTGGADESSVESMVNDDKNFQSDTDLAERISMRADVIAALATSLDAREGRLMRLRYGLSDGRPRSLQECAEALGLSFGGVRKLAIGCLTKLRDAAEVESLDEYLLTIA
jgi:RNA polymerase nonessential primary-like sigma factor